MKTAIIRGGGYSASKSTRDITIDLIKGIGIILMVFRHAEAPYSEIVSLFHMAIFFIASGYLFKPEKIKNVKELCRYFLRKIKSLWLPFVGFSTIFILLNNIFIQFNIYTDNPLFLEEYLGRYPSLASYMTLSEMARRILSIFSLQGNPQLGGALWFFQSLFYLSLGYAVIEFVLQKIVKSKNRRFIIQGVIAISFLILGYFCYLNDIGARGLNRFFSYYCLYYIGNLIKEYHLMDFVLRKKSLCMIILTVCSFMVLAIMKYLGISIAIVDNSYVNPFILLIASITGWLMLFSFATLLKKYDFIGNRLIAYVSIHSVPIIGLHFLAFKIVNWIAVMVYGIDYYMIAAFPVLMHGAWWIAYLIVGISVPLLVDWIYIYFKNTALTKLVSKQKPF